MKRPTAGSVTVAMMLAAAFAFAVEPDGRVERPKEPTRVEIPLPGGLKTPPVDKAAESLNRLRLRPAQDGLDVSETAHRPAARRSE